MFAKIAAAVYRALGPSDTHMHAVAIIDYHKSKICNTTFVIEDKNVRFRLFIIKKNVIPFWKYLKNILQNIFI